MTDRHHALDLVRGIAAVGVAVYHFLAWNEIAHIQSMGTFSVYLFFILSALTMMMVYGDCFKDSIKLDDIKAFYRNRVARLIPLLALIAFARLILAGPTPEHLAKAILTGSGLFALHLPAFLSNSVGAWSLGIEGLFYLVFPVVAVLAGAASPRILICIAVMLIAAQQALLFLLQAMPDDVFFQYYTTPLAFAPFFALGFIIHRGGGGRRLLMLPVALVLLVATMGFSAWVDAPLFKTQALYLGLTVLSAFVVFAAYRSAVPARLVGLAAFLGNISYSLYLTHWLPAGVLRRVAGPLGLSAPVQFALYSVAALALSVIVYQYFERPTRKLLRGRGKQGPIEQRVATLP